jgi:hypothetical protein
MVEALLHEIIPHTLHANGTCSSTMNYCLASGQALDFEDFLSRLHILVTSASDGVEVMVARDRESLVDLLIKTTYIPFVTGDSIAILRNQSDDAMQYYLDGGFSRALHPECQHRVPSVPLSLSSVVYTLHPGMEKQTAYGLWEMGRTAPPPLA